MAVLIVTIISAYSSNLTQAANQAQAQTLSVTEQITYVTNINVHFKANNTTRR